MSFLWELIGYNIECECGVERDTQNYFGPMRFKGKKITFFVKKIVRLTNFLQLKVKASNSILQRWPSTLVESGPPDIDGFQR